MNVTYSHIIQSIIFGSIFGATVFGPVQVVASTDHSNEIASEVPTEVLVRWKGEEEHFSVIPVADPEIAVTALQSNPLVSHVEPNYTRQISVFPNDAFAGDQYHLRQANDIDIDAGRAWNITTGSEDVVVAVIDTGVDLDHPDLEGNMWTNANEIAGNGLDDDGNGYIDDYTGWDFVEDDNDPNPTPTGTSWSDSIVVHGTHVAGLIGAKGNNATGVSGINWDVTIMPIRVFTDSGSSTIDDIYNAINYAVNNGADIINMSYGGGGYSVFEEEAIEAAYEQGVVSVAAAGNEFVNLNESPSYPVCHRYVVGVAATDALDAAASFTNYGTDCVDIAAPGDSILSTVYTNDSTHGFVDEYDYLSGTSMATPIVSGVVALMKSIDSTLTPSEVANILDNSADSLIDTTLGSGRVNAYQALLTMQTTAAPEAPVIKAYHASNKKKAISRNTPSADTTPYFVWKKPESTATITGYYVYFGPHKKNPVTYGTLQTKRSFSPVGVKGNNRTYRLRVKAVDTNGTTSTVGTFRYIAYSQ